MGDGDDTLQLSLKWLDTNMYIILDSMENDRNIFSTPTMGGNTKPELP